MYHGIAARAAARRSFSTVIYSAKKSETNVNLVVQRQPQRAFHLSSVVHDDKKHPHYHYPVPVHVPQPSSSSRTFLGELKPDRISKDEPYRLSKENAGSWALGGLLILGTILAVYFKTDAVSRKAHK